VGLQVKPTKEVVMPPFFTDRPKRDGAPILVLMVALSLYVVLAIVLLAKVRASWMLVGAVLLLVAVVAAVVVWLSEVLADDEQPRLPRTSSRRVRSGGRTRSPVSANARSSDRAPVAGARMAIVPGGLAPARWAR
jgi:hypothetical protein